jgi:biopolymer transport protein ExbD
MKSTIGACVVALELTSALAAQNPAVEVMRSGISVQLPVSSQAIAVLEADQLDATVVTVTAGGDLFVGTQPIAMGSIAGLPPSTVYVKADARAPYQQVLTVLSALSGRRVVLLTEATAKAALGTITPPYGISVRVGAP